MKHQKGSTMVLLVLAGIVAVIVVGFILYNQKKASTGSEAAVPPEYQTQYQDSAKTVTPINDTKDLDSASTSLDSTSTTQLDSQLKLLDSSTSSF